MPRPPLSTLVTPLSARDYKQKAENGDNLKESDTSRGYVYSALAVHTAETDAVDTDDVTISGNSPSMAQYNDILNNATMVEDVNVDCWGALFFVVVNDYPDLKVGRISRVGRFRIVFSVFIFLINLFIQFILLYFIFKLLMMPGMLSAQDVYKEFTERAFEGGTVDPQRFDVLGNKIKQEVCGLALSQAVFVRVVLFLWITTNVGELKSNTTKMNVVLGLPPLPEDLDMRLMVKDSADAEEPSGRVICLNAACKCLLMSLIFIPKYLICIFLTGTGCLWLMAAESIADLILNSLALAFVVQVDELLAQVFFPSFYLEDLSRLDLAGQAVSETDEAQEKRHMNNFLCSTVTLLCTVITVEAALRWQPVIPSYNGKDVSGACADFLGSQVPWCLPGQTDCFPES